MKNHIFKRLLALAIAIVMVMGMVPELHLHAHAEEETEHSYAWDGDYRDGQSHRLVCSDCDSVSYEPHFDSEDEDDRCDVCRTCMDHEGKSYVLDEGYRDLKEHGLKCSDCDLFSGWETHFDSEDDNDTVCDACGYCVGGHSYAWDRKTWDTVNHRVVCEDCGEENWESHFDGEDDDVLCDTCGFYMGCPHERTEWKYDDETHGLVCMDCGQSALGVENPQHTFENNNWYYDSQKHYPECDVCGYHKSEGEAHTLTGEDGKDQVCSTCGYTVHNYVWDQKTWDTVDHWVVCEDCKHEKWESHSDGNDDGRCDACGFNMACPHENGVLGYDDEIHWDACTECGQLFGEGRAHSFVGGFYHWESDKHYPECDGCDYYKADEGEAHVDSDEDTFCDICNYLIHEHTYEEGHLSSNNGMHYPACDLCGEIDTEKGEPCTDKNGDHGCDVCHVHMDDLCCDTDDNHICDVCEFLLGELCADGNGDHVCDVATCQRYMRELCFTESEGWICDTCGKNFCYHSFNYEPTSNHNGTHTALCAGPCGQYVTEDCSAWHYNASLITETTHTAFCACGYELPAEGHNYVWCERNATGHRMYCDDCSYEKKAWEAHTVQDGVCTVCKIQVTDYRDVYVGGVGLQDGQYLDNNGNITTTQPTGGYAYYKDGVLELNGYGYAGPGFMWVEYCEGEPDWAAIYATRDLTLVLKGENSLQITRPDAAEDESNYGDGIAAEGDLTIRGDGSLSIQVNDDGVQMNSGDVTIESGSLTVNSEDHGFDEVGSVTVTGGSVNVTAGDMGLRVMEDITISGGEIHISSKRHGLDTGSNLTISGGTVDIKSEDMYGTWIEGTATISGGTITINAAYNGIYAWKDVTISGGELTVTTRDSDNEAAILCDSSVTIFGGKLELASESDMLIIALETISVAHAEVTIEKDEMWGVPVDIVRGDSLTIEVQHIDGDDNDHDCDICPATNVDRGCHGGTATCIAKAVCMECGQTYGEKDLNNHGAWDYTAKGDTITATCSAGCGSTGTAAVSAEGKTYDGTAVEATVAYSDNWTDGDLAITYAVKDGAALTKAPENAGTYTASITCDNATASVEFTIEPADINGATVTVDSTGLSYDGTEKKPAAVTVVLGSDTLTAGDFQIAGYSDHINAGTDTAKITVQGKGNYTGTATGTFTIAKAAPQNVEGDISIVNHHATTYLIDLSAYKPTFGTWGNVSYTLDQVNITGGYYDGGAEIVDGKLSLPINAVEVENEGNIGSVTVNISSAHFEESTLILTAISVNKTDVSEHISLSVAPVTYGALPSPSYQFLGTSNGTEVWTLTYSSDDGESWDTLDSLKVDGKFPAGNYIVKAHYEDDAQAGEATAKFAVSQAASTVTTAPGKMDLTYNGDPQTLVTSGSTTDGTMLYSLTENGAFAEDIPSGTNAGDYTVWYYVDGDDNHLDSAKASVNVTINRKAVTVTANEATKEYGDADPALTYHANGLVDGDILKGNLSRAAGENVGTYAIGQGTLTNENNLNYTITFTGNTFTVDPTDEYTAEVTQNQNVIRELGKFVEPTYTGINGEALSGTIVYTYDAADYDYDQLIEKLKTLPADTTPSVGYTFTPTNSNYTGSKTGTLNLTLHTVKFTVNGNPATQDNAIVRTGTPVYGDTLSDRITISRALTAVLLDGTDTDYNSFSFSRKPGDPLPVGTHTVQILYNGTLAGVAYENVVVCAFEITVAPKSTTVTPPTDVKLDTIPGTVDKVIEKLPTTVVNNDPALGENTFTIAWSCDSLNAKPNGTSTFTWTITDEKLNNYAANVTSGTITVTNGDTYAVSNSGTNAEIQYAGSTYDVAQMFTKDQNAGAASYEVVGGTGAGTLKGSVLTVTKAGTIQIKMTTAAQGDYAAGEAAATLTVKKGAGAGSVTMEGWTYGEDAKAPITENGTGAATFLYTGNGYSSTEVPTDAGTYTVTATFAENELYEAATDTDTFVIAQKELTPTVTGSVSKTYDGTTTVPNGLSITLSGIVTGDDVSATASYAYESADAGTTKIGATGITLGGADVHNYTLKSTTAMADVGSITKAQQTITLDTSSVSLACGKTLEKAAQAVGAITYASSDAAIVKVDASGKLTALKPGTVTVTVTAAETGNYLPAQATYTVTVSHHHSAAVTAPTCEAKGYTTYTCACGDSYIADYVNALGHNYQAKVTKEASCTAEGVMTYTCANDASHTYTEAIAMKAHSPKAAVEEKRVEATCTAKGSYEMATYCGDCGKELNRTQHEIPAKGHSFGAWEAVQQPTCAVKGQERRDCKNCDHFEHRTTAALGHVYQDPMDPSCQVCGEHREVYVDSIPMLRMYNPATGEHHYTGSAQERDTLVSLGWNYEGVSWNAPIAFGDPVCRYYNPNTGDHHYTMSSVEGENLIAAGWIYEGVAWNSASPEHLPIYRLYNPNATVGSHHYTGSAAERDNLVEAGWNYEGIAWFALKY